MRYENIVMWWWLWTLPLCQSMSEKVHTHFNLRRDAGTVMHHNIACHITVKSSALSVSFFFHYSDLYSWVKARKILRTWNLRDHRAMRFKIWMDPTAPKEQLSLLLITWKALQLQLAVASKQMNKRKDVTWRQDIIIIFIIMLTKEWVYERVVLYFKCNSLLVRYYDYVRWNNNATY